jgi:hypothetical protein
MPARASLLQKDCVSSCGAERRESVSCRSPSVAEPGHMQPLSLVGILDHGTNTNPNISWARQRLVVGFNRSTWVDSDRFFICSFQLRSAMRALSVPILNNRRHSSKEVEVQNGEMHETRKNNRRAAPALARG